MSFRTTGRLFVAVLVAGLLVWVSRSRPGLRQPSTGVRRPVLPRPSGEVCRLCMEREGLLIECEKKEGRWLIRHPITARADEDEVLRTLSILESAVRIVTITESEYRKRELTLQDYGLAPPRIRFAVHDGLGSRELLVGRESPLGDVVYVKLASESDIIGTSRELLLAMPDNVEVLRSRTLVEGEASRVFRLEIQGGEGSGFIQLMRTGGAWNIQQPVVAAADGGKILEMLDALFTLRVSRFVWDPPARESRPSEGRNSAGSVTPTGLASLRELVADEGIIRISVWLQGDEKRQDLILEKPTTESSREIYARRGDEPSVYAVDRRIYDVFWVTVDDLRNRALFAISEKDVRRMIFETGILRLGLEKDSQGEWRITSPIEWRADGRMVGETLYRLLRLRIASFVEGQSTNLTEVGLQPPALTVTLQGSVRSRSADELIEEKTIHIGTIRDGSPFACVRHAEKSGLYKVSAESLRWIGEVAAYPLRYFDRTILSLKRDEVKRISLLKNGMEQTVQVDEGGRWIAIAPPLHEAARDTVEAILLHVENLRAVALEALQPASLTHYGLENPVASLTFGLPSEKGIQKSLLIGGTAGDRGVFAVIPGQNVVFVLAKEVAGLMTRDIVVPVSLTDDRKKTAGET